MAGRKKGGGQRFQRKLTKQEIDSVISQVHMYK